MVGALIVLGFIPAAAATGIQIVTGSTSGGVLSISAPGPLNLPTLMVRSARGTTRSVVAATLTRRQCTAMTGASAGLTACSPR